MFYSTIFLLSIHSQAPLNKNFIGLNRARRPHNAIFVSFNETTVPAECLEAAKVNWTRVCLKERDKQAEEQLKMVGLLLKSWLLATGRATLTAMVTGVM